MNSVLRYSTGVESDNRVRIARVAAAARIKAARVAKEAAQAADPTYCPKCGGECEW